MEINPLFRSNIIKTVALSFASIYLCGQTQLDIQGVPESTDTVAKIMVNYSGLVNTVGLSVQSVTGESHGIGGYFFGGNRGIFAVSTNKEGVYGKSTLGSAVFGTSSSGSGVYGISTTGYGVQAASTTSDAVYGFSAAYNGIKGESNSGHGVNGISTIGKGVNGESSQGIGVNGVSTGGHGSKFSGDNEDGFADIVLTAGVWQNSNAAGVILSDPDSISSDLYLVSYDDAIIQLDRDSTDSGLFQVLDDEQNVLFELDENGDANIGRYLSLELKGIAGRDDVCLDVNGYLSECSSSRRYKSEIIPFSFSSNDIMQLNPVKFKWKGDGKEDYGLVAEEVAALNPLLATFNKQGMVQGVKYDRIGVALIDVIKEQQLEIDQLKEDMAALKSLMKFMLEDEESR